MTAALVNRGQRARHAEVLEVLSRLKGAELALWELAYELFHQVDLVLEALYRTERVDLGEGPMTWETIYVLWVDGSWTSYRRSRGGWEVAC